MHWQLLASNPFCLHFKILQLTSLYTNETGGKLANLAKDELVISTRKRAMRKSRKLYASTPALFTQYADYSKALEKSLNFTIAAIQIGIIGMQTRNTVCQ